MDKTPLYIQIADATRQQVLDGKLRPGDVLPPVREMAERWDARRVRSNRLTRIWRGRD